MDSSTSVETAQELKDLDPAHIVLGNYQFPLISLSISQLIRIVFGLLEDLKPYLKYMPGFEPVSTLHCFDNGSHIRRVDKNFNPFFGNETVETISEKTRVQSIVLVETKSPQKSKRQKSTELLLTDKGNLLIWSYDYISSFSETEEEKSPSLRYDTMLDSVFCLLDRDKIESAVTTVVSDWKNNLYLVIWRLRDISTRNVSQREEQLKKARSVQVMVNSVFGMIKQPW